MRVTLLGRVGIAFVIGIALVAVVCYETLRNTWDVADSGKSTAHTFEVIASIQAARSQVEQAQSDLRGYVLTGSDSLLQVAAAGRARLDRALAALRQLTSDNASQQVRLNELRPLVNRWRDSAAQTVALRQTRGL